MLNNPVTDEKKTGSNRNGVLQNHIENSTNGARKQRRNLNGLRNQKEQTFLGQMEK